MFQDVPFLIFCKKPVSMAEDLISLTVIKFILQTIKTSILKNSRKKPSV